MVKRALALVLLLGGVGLGATLEVGSGAQAVLSYFSDLNGFVALVNQTIDFVQGQPDVSGEVPALGELRLGTGLALGETLGGVGFKAAMATWETGTSGEWSADGSQYPASLSLRVEFLALSLQAAFPVVPQAFTVGLSGGWGWANFEYASTFSLPSDWSIPFQPPSGNAVWRAAGPVGEVYARVALPLFPGFFIGVEAGLRLATLGVPSSGGTPLDLDSDGRGERLDLSGMWLGICVLLSFGL